MSADDDPTSGNRVFISCGSDEFEKPDARFPGFRSALRTYLSKADCEVKVQEDFRQEGKILTVAKLDDYIRRCAAVIHLVGAKPGAIPDAREVAEYLQAEPKFLEKYPELRAKLGDCRGITYTQWEAWLALHHGVSLFLYSTKDAASGQNAHLERLLSVSKYPSEFADTADLLGQLIGDLHTIVPAFPKAVQRLAVPRFLHHAAEFFLGREPELAWLDASWADGTHVLSVIAWGGVGKTALLSEWIQTRFIDKQWLDAQGRPALLAYFDWSFYDQGTRAVDEKGTVRTGSVGDFFEQALTFFGEKPENLGLPGKGTRLANFVRQQRTLLILDGLEPLQQPIGSPQAGRLLDPDLRDLLLALAQSHPGLCVVSSRQALTDLDSLHGLAARREDLGDLPKAVAVRLLRQIQITGTDEELEKACETFGCHALSLTLLGRFLLDAHNGDIRRIDRIRDLKRADELTREERHRTAWKVLEAYEEWLARARADGNPTTLAVLRLTGLFDRVASADCLAALRADPVIPGLTDAIHAMDRDEWNILLRRLERAHLIKLRVDAADADALAIDAHPLLREYFAKQLRDGRPEAVRAAHARLFDHLCEKTPHRPDRLLGLQPLYQAVVHGCLAGRQQEACDKVYFDRILRGTGNSGFYSTKKLGAIGADLAAVSAFFDEPWSRVNSNLTESDQAWLLNEAAYYLRALGRLTEALQPIRAGLEMYVQEKNWKYAAIVDSNLSELEVTLGRLTDAVADARQSITHADQSGDEFCRLVTRAMAADVLHQSGQGAEAGSLFAEAERMQKERQPEFDLLYSVRGFRYCEWLFAPAERAAWQALLRGPGSQSVTDERGKDDAVTICDEVERRARETLRAWRELFTNASILDIALDHLTLARVGMIRAILPGPLPQPTLDLPHVGAAVSGLRDAGFTDHLTRGLLTEALYHFVRGGAASACTALDQAQEIAERGPMPLYLADIHLHRARLFCDRAELAKARELIEKHGYWRRKEELEDAEAAL